MAEIKPKRCIGYVSKSGVFAPAFGEGATIMEKSRGSQLSTSRQIDDDLSLETAFGDKTDDAKKLASPPFQPEALTHLLEMNTFHFRACETKATDAAGSGWDVRPRAYVKNPRPSQRKKVVEFFDGLTTPINETLRKFFFDYESIGYAALEVMRENDMPNGAIVDIRHIPAHTIRAHKDRTEAGDVKKYAQIRGRKIVWFKDIGYTDTEVNAKTGAESANLKGASRANEIIFVRQYTQRSDFYGLPQIIPALGAMLGDVEREEYNISFFKNYGVPAYAIFVTGDYDPGPTDAEGRTELQTVIEEHMDEISENPHSTLLMTIPSRTMENGAQGKVEVHFEKLSDEVKDASFEKYRVSNRDEILGAHGVPLERIGIVESGSILGESAARESNEIYKRGRIDPLQDIVESRINLHITIEELGVEDFEWKLPELDTRDEEHDITTVTALFAMGMITPNQGIAHFGRKFGLERSDDPAMDYHYIGGQAVELGLAKMVQDPANDAGQVGQETDVQSDSSSPDEKLRKDLDKSGMSTEQTNQAQANIPSQRK